MIFQLFNQAWCIVMDALEEYENLLDRKGKYECRNDVRGLRSCLEEIGTTTVTGQLVDGYQIQMTTGTEQLLELKLYRPNELSSQEANDSQTAKANAMFPNPWLQILENANSNLGHQFWVNIIRAVASAQMTAEEIKLADDWEEWALDETDAWTTTVDERIAQWLDESMPTYCLLINWLGEYDYFREWDIGWDEKISFEREACGCPHDICWDMQLRLCPHTVDEDEVTVEVVEEFFSQWRFRFLNRVCEETRPIR